MSDARRMYVPAAGRDWALPFYDPAVKLLGGHPTRKALIEVANLRPGHRVLEIGCGTGTLALLIKRFHPGVDVVGLDPDPRALMRARRKADRAAVSIGFDRAFADEMPYPDGSFDRVFSSFMFHHLERNAKEGTLREVRRVLKSGGFLYLLDFAGHGSRSNGVFARLLHSSHRLEDNSEDRILALMADAGFTDPKNIRQGGMFFGHLRINYYEASAR